MSILWFVGCTEAPLAVVPDPRLDPAGWPTVVGGDRPAKVVAPDHVDGLVPLITVLHGTGTFGDLQDAYFGLSDRVEAAGFVLVVPDGTADSTGSRFWNATDACCDVDGTGVDDSGYLLGLVDEIESKMPIDPRRIAFVGHSNGGYMAYRLACDGADRVASIVSLAGATFLDEADCHADGPVHVLEIHGDVDTEVPYGGDATSPGAEETVARWADRAGCTGDVTVDGPIDHDVSVPGPETDDLHYTTGCSRDVRLWQMHGSGHVPTPTESFRDDVVDWVFTHPQH